MTIALPPLLVAGVGPLPPQSPARLYAPGLRIWGMARELARAGHAVRLVWAQFGDAAEVSASIIDLAPGDPTARPFVPRAEPVPPGGWPALLVRLAREHAAQAAIGSTDIMNHALATAGLAIPLWLDYFGDPMAEAQLQAFAAASDAGQAPRWSLVAPALARADRLSGCSREQSGALWGELAACGRLNQHTAFDPLVACLPPWIEPIPPDADPTPLVRGVRAPEDALLIFQTGGFNTWLDVQTLFAALSFAMDRNPRLHFAATGGAIAGHHTGGFARFEAAVAASPHRARFHLLGWLPLGRVPRLIAEGDLGLNVDLPCAEGRLGTRNRLLDWLLEARPVLTTPGCELAEDLIARGHAGPLPHGDPAAAGQALLDYAADSSPLRAAAARGAADLRATQTAAQNLRPLLDWAAAPKPASDLQAWNGGAAARPPLASASADSAVAAHAADQALRRQAWLERRLARLEGSRLVRLALRLRGGRDLEDDPPPGGP